MKSTSTQSIVQGGFVRDHCTAIVIWREVENKF